MALPEGYRFPDVSKYRTVCNWDNFKYPVAACKATEGSTGRDSSFVNWRMNMRARGLFPIAYHFLRAESSIRSQVENYLSAADDGKPFGIMLDLETSGIGSNPTISQANDWLNICQSMSGVKRSSMLCYMPRWWYSAHGGGSTALKDTILWGSNYTTSPNTSPYAGDTVEIIQYSSTAPIAGLCAPGTGDMNVSIGMTASQFKARISGGSVVPTPQEEDMYYTLYTHTGGGSIRCYVDGAVVGFPNITELNEFIAPYKAAGYVEKKINFAEKDDYDRYMNAVSNWSVMTGVQKTVTDIASKISSGSPVDVASLAAALAPLLPALSTADIESIRKVVDGELDKRNLSLSD